ncbi:MAG: hypothetical protein P9L92_01070 [Candidatus Electryonea clarkiae]|nr:hypothetical protein [Candidatus Electryonea clarkiae]MDP8289159.1 hypothetical protein [Candidatus Electryonea clarkiae]
MKIVFLILCRGNISRSPLIEYYLKHLYLNSDVDDKIDLDFTSGGIESKKDILIDIRIAQRFSLMGIDVSQHRSRQATFGDLKSADIILVTDKQQYNRIKNYFPQFSINTHHINTFNKSSQIEARDLVDPANLEEEAAFEKFFLEALMATESVFNYIVEVYREAEEKGVDFVPELFFKKGNDIETGFYGKYTFLKRRKIPMCPFCQSRRLRRNTRNGFIKRRLLPFFKGYPYHCGYCKRDFILFIGSHGITKDSKRSDAKWNKFIENERRLHGEEI